MPLSDYVQRLVAGLGAIITQTVLFIAFLSLPLAAAQDMGLSIQQTSTWIFTLYASTGLLGVLLSLYFKQPLGPTGNVFVLIFIASLASQISYPELIGASMVAGVVVTVIAVLGLTGWLAIIIPPPVVMGLLAGAIMPFVTGIFTSFVDAPYMIGTTFVAYLLGRRFLGTRLPAILPALVVGLFVMIFTGQSGDISDGFSLSLPVITMPEFSLSAIATLAPIFVVLVTLQANIPAMIFMKSKGYEPPQRFINIISGVVTVFSSFLGPLGVSLSLPATSIMAGESAGKKEHRYQVVIFIAIIAILLGALAGFAVVMANAIPNSLLLALAGLALIDVLAGAMQQITKGPLILSPLMAFVIALSGMSFLGFGAQFWALVIGTGVAWLLEADAIKQLNRKDTSEDVSHE